jgi:hypothetical protein
VNTNVLTIGDEIAKDFSDNKRHLTDSEQRRLAGMIDARFAQRAPAVADAAPTGTEAYTRELEERLSEVVAPKLADGSEWMETLPDGSVVPVMRGSPKLPAFIAKLHQAAADAQKLAAAAPTGDAIAEGGGEGQRET